MKTKGSLYPALWMTSAFIVTASSTMLAQNNIQKKPPNSGAQEILDSLNAERTSMLTAEGSVDPQEVEHVQRMLRLYELRAGFTDVEQAKLDLGLTVPPDPAEMAQGQQSSPGDVQQLQSEVADLHQQL